MILILTFLLKAKKLAAEHEDVSDGEGNVTDEDEAAEIDPEVTNSLTD